MKKIAILSGTLSRGGAERVSVYLSDKLRDFGISTVLITMKIAPKEYVLPDGVKRANVETNRNFVFGLRKLLKVEKPDALLIMGSSNASYAIPASLGLGIKTIVSERNSPANFAGRKLTKLISNSFIKFADGYVFQTEDGKQYYKKMLGSRGVVIANPLFTDGLPSPFIGERDNRIVSVGRLVDQKNHKMLIDSFSIVSKKYPFLKLEIYGDGPNKSALLSYIKSLNLQDKITLMGNVSDLFDKIKKAFCFVLSSNFEGMPNALIEAMAIGIPCISTNCPCGGPKTLINNGINGLLVDVDNSQMLANSIAYLIENKEQAKAIGNEGIKVRETLNADLIVSKWFSYIDNL